MATTTTSNAPLHPEKRATIRHFFYRQLFKTPILPQNVNLQGKTAIVTGSNTGLGLECARQLLDLHLSKLIIAVRDVSKGEEACRDLSTGRELEPGAIEVWKLDMLSYESVTAFAERAKGLERLDIAVLNAGIMKRTYQLAATGHEDTIQVNFLSTALLTILLLPIFNSQPRTDPGRIVWVQSDMASWAKFQEKSSKSLLHAFDLPENFNLPDRYSTSKLLGQIFVTDLVKRIPPSLVTVTMPNPGLCYGTGLGKRPNQDFLEVVAGWLMRLFGRPPSVGARALTDGAVNHGIVAHGQYLEDCAIQPKAPFVYQAETAQLATILWNETMAEPAFSGAERILNDLGQ